MVIISRVFMLNYLRITRNIKDFLIPASDIKIPYNNTIPRLN